MTSLSGKTLFITGASRGIGLAIALRAARDGANIVIAAKTDVVNPKLPGTIHSAAAQVEELDGKALAICFDIRAEDQVHAAVDPTVATFLIPAMAVRTTLAGLRARRRCADRGGDGAAPGFHAPRRARRPDRAFARRCRPDRVPATAGTGLKRGRGRLNPAPRARRVNGLWRVVLG